MHHIKRYLGHVSERMTEHYAKVALSEIDDVLQHVWVTGPGSAQPGELLTSGIAPLPAEEARALVIDLNRRSTPTEGGLCTFQPVVNGNACPWNLDCENCDKFVMTGADLLYWRRKRDHWHSLAERAPTDEMADWLHQQFEPTRRAIDGLERALVTYPAVARRAAVSRSFLYQNPDAQTLMQAALEATGTQRREDQAAHHAQIEASWRERALNAEEALKTAHHEIGTQRERIGLLLGQIRDLETDYAQDAAQRIATQNSDLKRKISDLAQTNRNIEEKLAASRSNNRFLDKRIADSPTSKPRTLR
ncbi:hypothetical protein GCM10009550_42970 [Actinocorallia libanotica]|uniref:Integrase n=2 Tax=Actinocorallia libanotica TaxID=46162 RepID=A0ABN1RGB7_9ACTN